MTDPNYDTRFLSSEEKQSLRKLHQRLMAVPRKRLITGLYAWSNVYSYNNGDNGGTFWIGRFTGILINIIDICRSHNLKNPKIFEALATGDTKALQAFFKSVHFDENEGITLFPGIQSKIPRKGLLIRDIEGHSTMSEQVFFVFHPLLELSKDDYKWLFRKIPHFN